MQANAEPRFKRRLPCQLRARSSAFSGMVLNLSRGGLFIQTTAAVTPGDGVRVELRLGSPAVPVPVEGEVVWRRIVAPHLRTVVAGGFGMRIRSAAEPYFQYLNQVMRGEAPPPKAPAPAAAPARPLDAWRVRLQHRAGPRSRILDVTAEGEDDARRRALQTAGGDWEVLEVGRR